MVMIGLLPTAVVPEAASNSFHSRVEPLISLSKMPAAR